MKFTVFTVTSLIRGHSKTEMFLNEGEALQFFHETREEFERRLKSEPDFNSDKNMAVIWSGANVGDTKALIVADWHKFDMEVL